MPRTWLVASGERLYCVLDDVRKRTPRLKWSIPGSELVDSETVTVPIATRDKSVRTGKLDIGERRGWLFTKALFRQRGVVDEVADLISSRMIAHNG